RRGVPRDAPVGAVDGAGGADAEPRVAVRVVARALDLGVELDRARDAADGQIAADPEPVALELLDGGAVERDLGVIGGVEEVLAEQVPGELRLLRDEILDAPRARDGAQCAFVGAERSGSGGEPA